MYDVKFGHISMKIVLIKDTHCNYFAIEAHSLLEMLIKCEQSTSRKRKLINKFAIVRY